jgi:hypothetical protein
MKSPLTRSTRWMSALALTLGLFAAADTAAQLTPSLGSGSGLAPSTGRAPAASAGAFLRGPGPDLKGVDDPTTDKDWDCYYWGYYIWNLGQGVGPVQGRIAWPNSCGVSQGPAGEFALPLVVIMHGDGQQYDDYNYLLQHLAFNGFIVASIDVGQLTTNEQRADRLHTFLSFLRDDWQFKAWVDPSRIALLGHGRSGDAAVTAARQFGDAGIWSNEGFNIKSVVSLAPTDQGGNQGHESLNKWAADSYLVIAGSQDDTVHGYCTDGLIPGCGGVPGDVQRTGFALYDRAGHEADYEGDVVLLGHVRKAMLFVDNANHARWRGTASCGFGMPGVISCEAHWDIAKGYLNAWMRWALRGQAKYKPFFTGELTPETVAEHDVTIRQQYSEGSNRRVVDHFEDAVFGINTLGGSVLSNSITVIDDGEVWDNPDYSSAHDTEALAIRWNVPQFLADPFIRWAIPDDFVQIYGSIRDVTRFSHLSFRMGLQNGSTLNSGDDLDVSVRLRDESGTWSNLQSSSLHTTISEPELGAINQVITFLPGYTPKTNMQTVRLPLDKFFLVDLENITDIEIRFSDRDSGEILMDSLEFSE